MRALTYRKWMSLTQLVRRSIWQQRRGQSETIRQQVPFPAAPIAHVLRRRWAFEGCKTHDGQHLPTASIADRPCDSQALGSRGS